jgi:hypothetical protein
MNESRIEGHIKYLVSVEMDVPSCASIQYLPESVLIKFERKRELTGAELTLSHSQLINVKDKVQKAEAEPDRKLKLFIDIFHVLVGENRDDVKKEILVQELISTGKFIEQDVHVFIKKAQQNGFIFERKVDTYALGYTDYK